MNPDTINAMSQAVEGLAAKAGSVAVQYGPQALEIAEQYVHATALLNLAEDAVLLLVALIGIGLYIAIWKGSKKLDRPGTYIGRENMWAVRVFCAIPALALILPTLISALQDFFSPATFFGLFYPKMAVLHYAISLTH